jgi:hypothetical protein
MYTQARTRERAHSARAHTHTCTLLPTNKHANMYERVAVGGGRGGEGRVEVGEGGAGIPDRLASKKAAAVQEEGVVFGVNGQPLSRQEAQPAQNK